VWAMVVFINMMMMMMKTKFAVLVFGGLVIGCDAFLKFPLRGVITTRLIVDSLHRSLTQEILDGPYVVDSLTKIHESFDFVGSWTMFTMLSILWFIRTKDVSKTVKLREVVNVNILEKRCRMGFLVILWILTKNVENAI